MNTKAKKHQLGLRSFPMITGARASVAAANPDSAPTHAPRLLLSACLASVLLVPPAVAFELHGYRWPDPTALTYDASTLPSKARRAFGKAVDEWELETAIELRSTRRSQNQIRFDDIDGSGGATTLARATYDGRSGQFLYRVTITFDDAERWYMGSGTPPSRDYDLQSVATHEIGHAFAGLGHPDDRACSRGRDADRPTMCQARHFGQTNSTHRRSLEPDDIAGAEAASSKAFADAPKVCVRVERESMSRDDIARAAEAIVAATVVSVSGENIESAIPSYRVQLIVHDHIMPTELAKTAMLSMDVIGAPDSDCPGSDPVPVIGDVVIAFLEERQLGDTIAVQPVAGVGSMLWVGQDGLLRPYADGAGDKLEAQTLDAVMDQINGARGQDSRQ